MIDYIALFVYNITTIISPRDGSWIGGTMIVKLAKTIVWTLLVAFMVYYLYTLPEAAAEFVKAIWHIVPSVGRFFTALIN